MNEFVKEHADEILKSSYRHIENELNNSCAADFLLFLNREVKAGRCSHDQLVEIGGYRRGLKMAREIIRKSVFFTMENYGRYVEFDSDLEVDEFIRGKIVAPWEDEEEQD